MSIPNVRNWAPYVVIGIGAATIAVLGYAIEAGSIFPQSIEHNAAIEMLRGTIQVDGVLIGFIGILATLAMTELREVLNQMAQTPPPPPTGRKESDLSKRWWDGFGRLLSRRWIVVCVTGVAVVLLVTSILSAFVSLSLLPAQDYAEPSAFILPVCTMVAGIDGIFLVLVLTAMRAQR